MWALQRFRSAGQQDMMSRNEASVESHIVPMARGSFALSYG